MKICSFEGCGRKHQAKGLCISHWQQQHGGKELTALRPYRASQEDRFMRYVDKTDTCWLWTGGITNKGYGQFGISTGKATSAHRLSYQMFVGPIPKGMTIHHKCGVTNCVNFSHLELATNRDNVAEMFERQYYIKRIAELEARVAELESEKLGHLWKST